MTTLKNKGFARRVQTMDLKGKAYAKVPDRIKEFREDCPRGLIETTPAVQEDNIVLFKARVVKDKSDPNSAESTGHSFGKLTNDKSFEKLETIAVGRALANLGYMASGEVASSEEMERYYEYQDSKKQEALNKLKTAKSLVELKEYYLKLSGNLKGDAEIIALKDQLKAKHSKS